MASSLVEVVWLGSIGNLRISRKGRYLVTTSFYRVPPDMSADTVERVAYTFGQKPPAKTERYSSPVVRAAANF